MEFLEREAQRVSLYLEEFRSSNAEIAHRVELQDKSASTAFALTLAIISALIAFATQRGFDVMLRSEAVALVPTGSAILSLFIFRHLDHDSSIISRAKYINRQIRPQLKAILESDVLAWEDFVHSERMNRPLQLAGVPLLGNALSLLYALELMFLTSAFMVRNVPGYGGDARWGHDALLAISLAMVVASLVMFGRVVITFGQIQDPFAGREHGRRSGGQ